MTVIATFSLHQNKTLLIASKGKTLGPIIFISMLLALPWGNPGSTTANAVVRFLFQEFSLFSHCSAGNVRELNWFQHIYVFVNSSGLIYYKIRSDYSVTCGLDMTYFPFDIQTCNIDVATQELSSYDANLTKGTGTSADLQMCKKFQISFIFISSK